MNIHRTIALVLALLLAALPLGCGNSGSHGSSGVSGGGTTTPPPPPPPPPPPTGTSGGSGGIPGVSVGAPATGLYYVSGDTTSRYAIYVPPGTGAKGLVVALHGVEGTSNPTGWFQVCVYYANLDRFIVVAPYGDTNDGGSGAWCQPWTRQIMDLVMSKYDVDLARVYCSAISGGCYPAIWLCLASGPATYTNYCGDVVSSGFQADFAAVGFTAPAYTPSNGEFASMQSKTAAELGFVPALWTDYGQNSSDGSRSTTLASWATARGYAPVTKVMRPGEGHSPSPPYSYAKQMFDFFEANPKP